MYNSESQETFSQDNYLRIGLPNNTVYFGEHISGQPEGRGHLFFQNGLQYSGDVNRGMMQGRGQLKFNNGVIYIGEFDQNMKHGRGQLVYPNGFVERVEYLNDVRVHESKYEVVEDSEAFYDGNNRFYERDSNHYTEVLGRKEAMISATAHSCMKRRRWPIAKRKKNSEAVEIPEAKNSASSLLVKSIYIEDVKKQNLRKERKREEKRRAEARRRAMSARDNNLKRKVVVLDSPDKPDHIKHYSSSSSNEESGNSEDEEGEAGSAYGSQRPTAQLNLLEPATQRTSSKKSSLMLLEPDDEIGSNAKQVNDYVLGTFGENTRNSERSHLGREFGLKSKNLFLNQNSYESPRKTARFDEDRNNVKTSIMVELSQKALLSVELLKSESESCESEDCSPQSESKPESYHQSFKMKNCKSAESMQFNKNLINSKIQNFCLLDDEEPSTLKNSRLTLKDSQMVEDLILGSQKELKQSRFGVEDICAAEGPSCPVVAEICEIEPKFIQTDSRISGQKVRIPPVVQCMEVSRPSREEKHRRQVNPLAFSSVQFEDPKLMEQMGLLQNNQNSPQIEKIQLSQKSGLTGRSLPRDEIGFASAIIEEEEAAAGAGPASAIVLHDSMDRAANLKSNQFSNLSQKQLDLSQKNQLRSSNYRNEKGIIDISNDSLGIFNNNPEDAADPPAAGTDSPLRFIKPQMIESQDMATSKKQSMFLESHLKLSKPHNFRASGCREKNISKIMDFITKQNNYFHPEQHIEPVRYNNKMRKKSQKISVFLDQKKSGAQGSRAGAEEGCQGADSEGGKRYQFDGDYFKMRQCYSDRSELEELGLEKLTEGAEEANGRGEDGAIFESLEIMFDKFGVEVEG